ncbi:MAG TPA: ATP-binding protein [Candidatus Acidoferrum sp.]|nr:ATP-binding protein [Candidatus Acidoferrum sp.]
MSETQTKVISILPDRSLMPKIGQTGYSVSQAIAELVDNSIDARWEGKALTVEVILNADRDLVQVSDDGMGMSEDTAANSIRLAHSAKKNKLGEFGLGLKTAATSLGKKFQITTKEKDSVDEYTLAYDEDKWLKEGDWTKHEMKIKSGVEKKKYGTTIVISGLHFRIYPNLPGNIRKDLATRFAPFIENGEVRIKVNTKWCEPEPLILRAEYHPPDGKEEFRLKLESGNEVWGWRGLLKQGSDKGEYGFRVFRRGRLIMQFAKLGFNPHPEARQIVGEIHLDYVPVTHNKREFMPESPLYQEIVTEGNIFWEFMRELVREARSSVRKTQIDQGIVDKVQAQKDNIMKAIKGIPELREYAFPDLKERIRGTEDEHDGLSDLEVEKRNARSIVTVVEEPQLTSEQGRKPKKTQIKRTYFITVNGKKFKVEHSFVDLKTDQILKDKTVDEEKGIQVFTNIAFPAFANTKDHVFYATWHIAEAIAEVMVERNEKPAEEIVKIRDLILKKSSELTRQLDEVERETKIAERIKKEWEARLARINQLKAQSADLTI